MSSPDNAALGNTHAADNHSAEHVAKSLWIYKALFGTLLVLTLVTVALSYVHIDLSVINIGTHDSQAGNIIVGLIVATIKAGLVAAIFMHLWGEKRTIWLALIFTIIFVIGLFALSFLALVDPVPRTKKGSHGQNGWKSESSWSHNSVIPLKENKEKAIGH